MPLDILPVRTTVSGFWQSNRAVRPPMVYNAKKCRETKSLDVRVVRLATVHVIGRWLPMA